MVLERTGACIFCRNEMSKMQLKCVHNTPLSLRLGAGSVVLSCTLLIVFVDIVFSVCAACLEPFLPLARCLQHFGSLISRLHGCRLLDLESLICNSIAAFRSQNL